MDVASLLQGLATRRHGPASASASSLTDDSRKVTPGALLVMRGAWSQRSGEHLADALRRGASAVLTQDDAPADAVPTGVAWYSAGAVDQPLAGAVADRFFSEPAGKLRLIGVTGTNGKTTIATLTQYLLRQAGLPCGLIGTVAVDTGGPSGAAPAELTTPGAIELRALFAQMVRHGCACCAMEVSSHALHQGRVAGLTFDAAVFTNLTQDHLDYHGTMDAYADAKAMLFTMLGPTGYAVINADDERGAMMASRCSSGRVLWTTVGDRVLEPGMTVCRASPMSLRAGGSTARFDGPWGSAEATLPMVGRHNLSNALQAASAAHAVTQMTARELRERLETCPPVPGRLEPVVGETPESPAVLVDYAHTPDALDNALSAVRPVTRGRLVVVFGCGGDRDRTKRPRMMQAALRGADAVVLTSDNPRREDPRKIIEDALQGAGAADHARITVEPDRALAIRRAIADAGPDDTVLIAGKGHEDYQIVADPPGQFGGQTRKAHFDDCEHAADALRQRPRPRLAG